MLMTQLYTPVKLNEYSNLLELKTMITIGLVWLTQDKKKIGSRGRTKEIRECKWECFWTKRNASRDIIYYVDIIIYQQSRTFGYCNMFEQLCLRCRSVIDLPQGLSGAVEVGLSFIQITANLTCQPARPLSTETTFGLKSIPKQWWKKRMERGREQQTRKSDSAWHLPGLCSVNNQAKPGSDTPKSGLLLNTLLQHGQVIG